MNPPDISLFEQGGPIMWPLMAVSVLGMMFFIERLLFFHKSQIGVREFIEGIRNLVWKNRFAEALTVCEETPGPHSGLVKAAIFNRDRPEAELRLAVQQAALLELPSLEKRVGSIAAIARIAPLLGLIGSLLAALNALTGLQQMGHYADAEALSGLLVSAIVSSITGISIAVMAHLTHHFLFSRLRAVIHDMEWVGAQMMQLLTNPLPEGNFVLESVAGSPADQSDKGPES